MVLDILKSRLWKVFVNLWWRWQFVGQFQGGRTLTIDLLVVGSLPSGGVTGNADFHTAAPQISQLLHSLHTSRGHLNQLWAHKKIKLEQCFQLRLFEQDVEKVINSNQNQKNFYYWIILFLLNNNVKEISYIH